MSCIGHKVPECKLAIIVTIHFVHVTDATHPSIPTYFFCQNFDIPPDKLLHQVPLSSLEGAPSLSTNPPIYKTSFKRIDLADWLLPCVVTQIMRCWPELNHVTHHVSGTLSWGIAGLGAPEKGTAKYK